MNDSSTINFSFYKVFHRLCHIVLTNFQEYIPSPEKVPFPFLQKIIPAHLWYVLIFARSPSPCPTVFDPSRSSQQPLFRSFDPVQEKLYPFRLLQVFFGLDNVGDKSFLFLVRNFDDHTGQIV